MLNVPISKQILNSFYYIQARSFYWLIIWSRLFLNELRLMSYMYWHYKASYIINALMTTADFIWWMLLIDGGTLVASKIAPLAIGYITWIYANYIIYDANYLMIETSQTGVLEQIYLSAVPLYLHLLGRFAAGAIICTLELAVMMLLLFYFFPVHIPVSIFGVAILVITIIGICGFAFMIAGIGLVFKKSQSFCYMLLNGLLFLNGSVLPLESMPIWVQYISKTLPTTQGITVLRAALFDGETLAQSLKNGSLIVLIANSIFYLVLGWFVLRRCEIYAQEQGIIGHY